MCKGSGWNGEEKARWKPGFPRSRDIKCPLRLSALLSPKHRGSRNCPVALLVWLREISSCAPAELVTMRCSEVWKVKAKSASRTSSYAAGTLRVVSLLANGRLELHTGPQAMELFI